MDSKTEAVNGFGEYLTSEYEILRRVFSFLSVVDLGNCIEVCEEWKEAAMVTIKERRVIQCLMLTDKNTKPIIVSDAALTLSFRSLPQANCDKEKSSLMTKESLHFVARYGIIAIIQNSKPLLRRHRVELPLTPRTYLHAAVRFPQWDSVTIRTITIGLDDMTESDIEALINLPEDVPIKAMILMTYDDGADRDVEADNLALLMNCLKRRKKDFALGGCRLDQEEGNEEVGIKCVLFAGDNVEAGSCVLDNNCRTSEDINFKVEKLSKSVTQIKNSLVLAFRCCDRQKVRRRYNYQPRENIETWETNAIKNFFPMAPAIGCYGVGEFGCDYPVLSTAKKPRLASGGRMGIEFGFSTILLYIGFKK